VDAHLDWVVPLFFCLLPNESGSKNQRTPLLLKQPIPVAIQPSK
jgi:hypothetical protein